jgi:hypothetical protein
MNLIRKYDLEEQTFQFAKKGILFYPWKIKAVLVLEFEICNLFVIFFVICDLNYNPIWY